MQDNVCSNNSANAVLHLIVNVKFMRRMQLVIEYIIDDFGWKETEVVKIR